ncbi:hypothetical protein ES695_01950 [Candidatus Atribacteria bacterium 1244-E10-H5-B2]|nr:MAG: hypothetical protein ES695_01950 [Candidatus Atribacteria bacterium 1244-E10-H5-B2]
MFISREKFEAFHTIRRNYSLYVKDRKDLKDDTIIRVAKEEYNVVLTEEDIKEMMKRFEHFMYKYIN